MPDRGVPSPATIDADRDLRLTAVARARNHTTTQQWQSFEMRMRHRRAERCRLRAEVAIEAGFPDEAREALDEARHLQPELPGLVSAEERLAVAAPTLSPESALRPPVRRRRLAAGVSVVLAAGFGGWLISSEPAAPRAPVAAAKPAQVAPSPEATSGAPEAADATPADASNVAAEIPRDVGNAARPPATPEVTGAPVIEMPPPRPRTATRSAEAPPATQIRADPPPAPTAPAAASPSVVVPTPGLPAAGPEPVQEADVYVEPRPAPVTTSTPRAPSAEVNVRAALTHYEAAYSTLNASAARAVWPTVDAAALGRAFDSLQAQRISLGNCSVLVTGQSARATCSGSATWTPKIGGGTRTESRRWTFDLAQAGDAWEIVRATAR
jgi:hypothetical protein